MFSRGDSAPSRERPHTFNQFRANLQAGESGGFAPLAAAALGNGAIDNTRVESEKVYRRRDTEDEEQNQ